MTYPFAVSGYKAKLAVLKKLSSYAKPIAKAQGKKTNEVLLDLYKAKYEGKVKFQDYKSWKKQGKKPKKNTAWCIWGKPRRLEDGQKLEDLEDTSSDDKFFYPITYVWASPDVEKIN